MLSKIVLFFLILSAARSLRISSEDDEGNQQSELADNKLHNFFQTSVKEHVRWNNWNLGCLDLVPLLPYMRIISDSDQSRPKIFIDVGANEGQEAEAIHKIFSGRDQADLCKFQNSEFKVFSFEADPATYSKLNARAVTWSNSTFQSFNMAVGSSDKNISFAALGTEGSHIGCDGDHSNCNVVQMQRLDSFYRDARAADAQLPEQIFMLKIDTEGHDLEVIQSASGLMAPQHIDFIIFEISTNAFIKQIAKTSHQYGYMCFILTPDIMIPVQPESVFWYQQLEVNVTQDWWGNGLCAVKSPHLRRLWNMFHANQPSDSPVFLFANRFL